MDSVAKPFIQSIRMRYEIDQALIFATTIVRMNSRDARRDKRISKDKESVSMITK